MRCEFDSPTSLALCQKAFKSSAETFCRTSFPPAGSSVTASSVIPSHRPQSLYTWNHTLDAKASEITKLLQDLLAGQSVSNQAFVKALIVPDTATIAIFLAIFWILLLVILLIPSCFRCFKDSWRQQRHSNTLNSVLTIAATVAASLVFAIGIALSLRQTTDLLYGEYTFACWGPSTIYSLISLQLQNLTLTNSTRRFAGLLPLGNLLMTMITSTKDITELALHGTPPDFYAMSLNGPLAPILWTPHLLNQPFSWTNYLDLQAAPSFPHTLLSYEVLRSQKTLTAEIPSNPLQEQYNTLYAHYKNSRHQPPKEILKSVKSLLDEMYKAYNLLLRRMSALVNSIPVRVAGSASYERVIKAALVVTYCSCFGLFVGLLLFGAYLTRSRSHSRSLSRPQRGLLLILAYGYSVYGILLLTLAGGALVLMKFLRNGCHLVEDAVLNPTVEYERSLYVRKTLGKTASGIISNCIAQKGSGDLLQVWGLKDFLSQLSELNGQNSSALSLTATESVEDTLRPLLQDISYATLVVPNMTRDQWHSRPDTNFLMTHLPTDVLKSGIQEATITLTSCQEEGKETQGYCQALQKIWPWSASTEEASTAAPSAATASTQEASSTSTTSLQEASTPSSAVSGEVGGEDARSTAPLVVTGTSLMVSVMNNMLEGCGMKVCLAATDCSSVVDSEKTLSISPLSIAYYEISDDDKSSWPAVKSGMCRTREAWKAFECFDRAPAALQRQWTALVHYATIKSLALSPSTRPVYSPYHFNDPFPGWFDNCPLGKDCSRFYVCHQNSNSSSSSHLSLQDYTQFTESFQKSLQGASDTFRGKQLGPTIQELARQNNPIQRFADVASTINEDYNCQIAGSLLREVQKAICTSTGPSWTNLAFGVLFIALAHLITFLLIIYHTL